MSAERKKADALNQAYRAGQESMRNRAWEFFNKNAARGWERKNWLSWLPIKNLRKKTERAS